MCVYVCINASVYDAFMYDACAYVHVYHMYGLGCYLWRRQIVHKYIIHGCIDAYVHTRIHEYIHTKILECIRMHIHACSCSFGSVIITVGGMSTTSRSGVDGAGQRSSPFGDCHAAGARFLQAMYVLALTPHRVHRVRKL